MLLYDYINMWRQEDLYIRLQIISYFMYALSMSAYLIATPSYHLGHTEGTEYRLDIPPSSGDIVSGYLP